jgi:hypothetical protein
VEEPSTQICFLYLYLYLFWLNCICFFENLFCFYIEDNIGFKCGGDFMSSHFHVFIIFNLFSLVLKKKMKMKLKKKKLEKQKYKKMRVWFVVES